MTEREYLAEVYELAAKAPVSVHHCNDSRYCHGTGFPDLVLIGARGVLWREVKASPGDRATPEQTALLWLLRATGQDARLWTERDLATGKVAEEIASIT